MVQNRASLTISLGLVGLLSLGCGGGDDGAATETAGSGG